MKVEDIFITSQGQITYLKIIKDISVFGKITTDTTDLNLLPVTGKITKIGNGTPNKLPTPTNNDFYVTGRLEVDGITYFDSGVTITGLTTFSGGASSSSSFSLKDNCALVLGLGDDSYLFHSIIQTPNALFLGVGVESNGFIIGESADRTFNFLHPLQTNPTLFIHSANQSTNEWTSFTHNQTDGVIGTGKGKLIFNPFTTIETAKDIEITDSSKGYIMRSPDNSRWRMTINDSGVPSYTKIA